MKYTLLAINYLLFTCFIFAQELQTDSLESSRIILNEVLVSALRVNRESPVTFSDLSSEQIAPRNLGQDIPILMNFLPSVVTTSDAGAGVGYTGIRVRGSDASRVNVTINGIPYNDAESHGTFWVNMPDFASSTESLQLQRGVGTSTNGSGAFGASLNLLTDGISEEPYAQIASSFGSFHTLRNNLKFSTGLMKEAVEVSGRISKISSDGYIDRASSKLNSYFLQGAFASENTLIKALLFGGHEITYQSWNGIDAQTLRSDRTYNTAGIYTDEAGNTRFYENEVDNYKQDHAQLHWNESISESWSSTIAFHYTRGRGFFEQFREDDDFDTYGFAPITIDNQLITTTDLVRRRWLDNDFYGTVFSARLIKLNYNFILGGSLNRYEGDHFGEVIWTKLANSSGNRDRYYEDESSKNDLNFFSKLNYDITEQWHLYADLQYRGVRYKANGEDTGIVDDDFHFFNPKAGITYDLNDRHNFYLSFARANREPNRNDYESGNPRPEKLNDFELGWRILTPDFRLSSNIYYMHYKDQLVLTGELNDVGAPLRANVGRSYRIGLEVDAEVHLGNHFRWQPNIALSTNRNIDFVFQRDGRVEELGNTHIAFSPGLIVGNALTYRPDTPLLVTILTKIVGRQYMGNIDSETSRLASYSQTDLNFQYELKLGGPFRQMVLNALLNNVFDAKYVSNGFFYTYDDDFSTPGEVMTVDEAGYYPQAGIHFLLGATLRF